MSTALTVEHFDETMGALAQTLANHGERFDHIDDRLAGVESGLTSVESRLTRVEDRLTNMEES